MKLAGCFPTYYDSTEACVEYLTAYYNLNGDLGSECETAITSYFQCGAALTCMELSNTGGNSCDDEYLAAYEVCMGS